MTTNQSHALRSGRPPKRIHRLLASAGLVLTGVGAIHASDPGGAFEITASTIAGGGGASSGADVTLAGTIGQHDAGDMSGGAFELRGGFWHVAAAGGAPCVGDLDGNAMIGFGDLLVILAAWGPCEGCPADIDEDGVVGFSDVLFVLSAWGACP